jgi:PAS domain S-box-containing protein
MEQIQKERDRFFDLTRDLICITDFDGYFKTLNPAWESTLGFSRAELLAAPFLDFIHPDDRSAAVAEVARLGAGGETVNLENRYRCQDGSYRWFSWNARAALPQKLIYAAARDITEQKESRENIVRLNEQLKNHTVQLETANKELEAFSYSVSHDLRAPVRHIDGFVKMLAKHANGSLDERGRRFLNIIEDAAHQMGALIDDLLLFSRMSRSDLHPANVALNSLVDEAIASLHPEMNGRNIQWRIGSLPPAQADPAMLRQVWVNLIANAIKYSRPRNPAEIEIGGSDAGRGESVYYVRDNGVGFDMQYVEKLFGVFQRLHRSEEFEGTGIGLANVRRIVSRHGGRTWAESRLNEGATFYFSLPNTLNIKSNH